MPEVTVVSPAAAVPADRLTLGATDARHYVSAQFMCCDSSLIVTCMAEE